MKTTKCTALVMYMLKLCISVKGNIQITVNNH
jgi:hypothetical protein